MTIEFSSEMIVKHIRTDGTELDIVNAARYSTISESFQLAQADYGLLKSLIREKHGAPFEMCGLVFAIEVPISIARQWFKHRFSSFSEQSGRYSELPPKFYIPRIEDVRQQLGKRMSYVYKQLEDETITNTYIEDLKDICKDSYDEYEYSLKNGIAKEIARLFLPANLYTRFRWKTDLRNLTNFLILRNDEHAQLEIREAAKKVEEVYATEFPIMYDIWNEVGRPPLAGID